MIGLDTNVLVRFVTRDDEEQWQQVNTFLQANCSSKNPGYVSCIVLCEVVWVLSRGYRHAKEDIVTLFQQLILTSELKVEAHDCVRCALREFENGKADFSDYLIGHLNKKQGCETTVTFDQKAADHAAFSLLQ